ncbi:MAG: hypothetical protein R2764_07690 [Bacteroidales bacterium]
MIIGIGGVSNAGKSKLAEEIKNLFPERLVQVICQDDHVRPKYEIPLINDHVDWESPESINFAAFEKAILEANGIADVVISEGLFAFYNPHLYEQYDKKIVIEIPKETFLERKRKDLRWGKEPDWYIEHIWRSYQQFGKPFHQKPDFLSLDGNKIFDMEKILRYIKDK